MDPNQISPTDVVPGPIISSCCHSSPLGRRNQYQPMWDLTKYMQHTLGLSRSPSVHKHLCHQTLRFLPTFPNRRRSPINCSQPPPWLTEILSTGARAFKPRQCDPSGAVWNIGSRWSSATLVGGSFQLYHRKTFCRIFMFVCLSHPF